MATNDIAAKHHTIDLRVEGMNCGACAAGIEKALKSVPGVDDATADLATKRAVVRFADPSVTVTRLAAAVADAGYQAEEIPNDRN